MFVEYLQTVALKKQKNGDYMNNQTEFTIYEIAIQLGVTRQYIYKKLAELDDQLEPYTIIKNKIKFIKIDGVNILKDNIKNNIRNYYVENNISKKKEINNVALISSYENQIKFLKDELLKMENNIPKKKIGDDNVLISSYENQINYLKDELVKKDEFYNKLLDNMQKESLEKNKLLENMQVLLKDQKLLIESKENRKWWKFWKS
jgi:hypothetical protein